MMTPTELNACLKDVWMFTEHNNLSRVKSRLKPLDKETRRKVMTLKSAEKTPLFLACWKGHVHFVNYFLDECGADIEQKGVFEVSEDQSRHLVTPLWCAAVANKLDVVKALVDHGADVNGESDTQSTPVRSACFMSNIEVVKFLIKHGADIHKPNVNGGTCLINSVQSVDLCQFLINHGADVNAQDNSGNLALHYAIREGRLESVQLLVSCGSDVTIKNELGDDALQTASLRGFDNIVDYLFQATKPGFQRIVDAYELMGANYVDEKHDISQGIYFWKEALQIRLEHPDEVEQKPILKKNKAYENASEFRTTDELENIVSCPDATYMQALLIRERILGPKHKDTTFGLMYRGAVYADTHQYQRCIDIWCYALHLRHVNFEPLNHETIFINLLSITKLFWEIWTEQQSHSHPIDEKLEFDDVYEVLVICVDQIEKSCNRPVEQPVDKKCRHREYFHTVLLLSLHLLNLMCFMELNEQDSFQFRKLVHKLILLKPRGQAGRTLLHLAVDSKSSSVDSEECSRLPNFQLVRLLIDCGSDVNAVDDQRNTPLHVLGHSLKLDHATLFPFDNIADLLVANSAHVDACNSLGEVAYHLVAKKNKMIAPFDHITLKCLASKVIRKYGLKYDGEVPNSLKPFIEMH